MRSERSRAAPWLAFLLAAGLGACCDDCETVGGGSGPVEAVTVSADGTVLIVGETLDVHAMSFIGRGAVTATKTATWHVEPPEVARMARPGTLIGLASGTVTVVAELDGVRSDPLEITVLHAPPPGPGGGEDD